jgi:hypothetical protein
MVPGIIPSNSPSWSIPVCTSQWITYILAGITSVSPAVADIKCVNIGPGTTDTVCFLIRSDEWAQPCMIRFWTCTEKSW